MNRKPSILDNLNDSISKSISNDDYNTSVVDFEIRNLINMQVSIILQSIKYLKCDYKSIDLFYY